MESLRLAPSEDFIGVLKELHSLPSAPKSVTNYFKRKVKENGVRNRKKDNSKVEEIKEKHNSDDETEETCDISDNFPYGKELMLSTADIKWVHTQLRQRGMKPRIHELINSSEVLFPKPVEKERNPELEERVSKLRAQQEDKEYQDMTKNLRFQSGNKGEWSGLGRELREMHSEVNRQIIAGVQYIVSIVGTFFAIFVGMSFYGAPLIKRLIVSLICAAVVGIAELYFIIREDMRAEGGIQKKIK